MPLAAITNFLQSNQSTMKCLIDWLLSLLRQWKRRKRREEAKRKEIKFLLSSIISVFGLSEEKKSLLFLIRETHRAGAAKKKQSTINSIFLKRRLIDLVDLRGLWAAQLNQLHQQNNQIKIILICFVLWFVDWWAGLPPGPIAQQKKSNKFIFNWIWFVFFVGWAPHSPKEINQLHEIKKEKL